MRSSALRCLTRQLNFNPEIGDDHPVITHLPASLCFRSMDSTITSSTSRAREPSNERTNVAAAEKQLESMGYRLTQERGRWTFLTPRLENADKTDKTRESAPPLIEQLWGFLEEQLELAENREMTVVRFFTAANEVTIGGFWMEHAKSELMTRKNHEILRFLSPCWENKYLKGFYAGDTIFEAFVQELLNMPINLILALYLVYPRYLFNMGSAYMFSRGVKPLRIDGYLRLLLLTHGKLTAFHRLTKYGERHVRKEGSPECGDLFVQVCCWTEDVACGVSSDGESTLDGQRKKSQEERRGERDEWGHT